MLSKEEETKKWRTEAERLERLGSTAEKEMNALRFEIRDREETIHDRVSTCSHTFNNKTNYMGIYFPYIFRA